MSRIGFRSVLLLISALAVCSFAVAGDSHVRIVRLSYVEGNIQIDRGSGQFEKAMTNLPIAQGTKLRTADDGRAEVEFEDGSTLRLTPETAIQFSDLSLQESGGKVSTLDIEKGTVYVDYMESKNSEFTVHFARETVRLSERAHLRIGIGDAKATVAVFRGEVQAEGPAGATLIKKSQTGNFDLSNSDSFVLAKKVEQSPFDNWDKQQSDFHVRYASNSNNSYSPYGYGTSDLAYYGNFFNAPGYGMMWQPYFVGAGWDPFMDGAWAFQPGWGFGWVSAYPWGWTPYHYGTWVFLPGYGWAWQPGGVWTTWYAQPRIVNAPAGFAVPQAPTSGRTTVAVNRGPTAAGVSGSKLVIRNNSAGLGIRRGEINNLAKVSQQVQEHGTATQNARIAPTPQATGPALGSRESGRVQPSSSRASRPMPQVDRGGMAPASRSSAPGPSPGAGRVPR